MKPLLGIPNVHPGGMGRHAVPPPHSGLLLSRQQEPSATRSSYTNLGNTGPATDRHTLCDSIHKKRPEESNL